MKMAKPSQTTPLAKRGIELLHAPIRNMDTAFTQEERERRLSTLERICPGRSVNGNEWRR